MVVVVGVELPVWYEEQLEGKVEAVVEAVVVGVQGCLGLPTWIRPYRVVRDSGIGLIQSQCCWQQQVACGAALLESFVIPSCMQKPAMCCVDSCAPLRSWDQQG